MALRWIGVLALMVGLAVAVVHLRAEQRRCAERILRSERERVELRRRTWELQMAIARMRSPASIRALK